jgi:hypothetical protein
MGQGAALQGESSYERSQGPAGQTAKRSGARRMWIRRRGDAGGGWSRDDNVDVDYDDTAYNGADDDDDHHHHDDDDHHAAGQ